MSAALTTISLADEAATEALGRRLAGCVRITQLIFLRGELGAGKTTLCRGFLRGLGYQGLVKSPTYTLCETYRVADVQCLHCDFYRLSHPEEMEYLGLREQFDANRVLLIEWPEIATQILPPPDLDITLSFAATGRIAELRAGTPRGESVIPALGTGGDSISKSHVS
ncbi:MAG: tRNA (adenosine(37)-N6)-threonylcarbamoyltransferase complex ATPase subunit type 1 TsaE [Gammaproteobacteria bacterium]|nr:tRNA (adenosine(37)-N6)-threonylcarbamoyltransferase complex ATPase subunit type 1 TsaE [Gammaproteobacteria bacterium]